MLDPRLSCSGGAMLIASALLPDSALPADVPLRLVGRARPKSLTQGP